MKRLRYLQYGRDTRVAGGLNQPELLRCHSNLPGSDPRITNFGRGNSTSKVKQKDSLTGENTEMTEALVQ
jgi:rhamnose utilization protein RhaD (predicted bifunctional aldolase and dehydrogenase)